MLDKQEHKSCRLCKNYHWWREDEGWEMPHIFLYVRTCDAKPSVANLKQFPFVKTKCSRFEKK